jgi:hypothetical protein
MKLFRLFELEDRIDELEDELTQLQVKTYEIINKHKYDSHYWIYKNGDEFSILGTEYLVVDTYLASHQEFIYLVYDKTKKHTETWTEQELKNWMFTDKNI